MLNGFLVTVIGINALITTLGTLAIFSGLAFIITNGVPIGFQGFGQLALNRPLLNIPWSVFIFFAFIAMSVFILRMTVFGRSLYAIGANRDRSAPRGHSGRSDDLHRLHALGLRRRDRRPGGRVPDG